MGSSVTQPRPFRLRRRARYLLASLLATIVIGTVSLLPGDTKNALHTSHHLHSTLHVLAFALLAFIAFRGVRSTRAHFLLICAGLLLAGGTELGEHRIYGSQMEYRDIVADGLGVGLGSGLAAVLHKRRVREQSVKNGVRLQS